MAVAHDAQTRFPSTDGPSGTNSVDTTTGSRTFTHTPVGTPKGVVVVIVSDVTGTAPVTGVLYGGVAMSLQETAIDTSEAGRVDIYTLASGVPSGAQTVTLQGASTAQKWVTCSTVTASSSTVLVNAHGHVDTTIATNPAVTLTTTLTALLYGAVAGGAAAPSSYAAGTGFTAQFNNDLGAQSARSQRSTSTVAAGSNSYNFAFATSDDWCIAAVAIAETPTPTQTTVARLSLAPADTPETRTAHSIKVRARTTTGSSGTIRAALYESTTNRSGDLESTPITNTLADYTLAIPDASAANITDYTNLEVRVWGYDVNGAALVFEIDQVYLELPAAPAGSLFSRTASDTGLSLSDGGFVYGYGRALADTGLAFGEAVGQRKPVTVTDTALTVTETRQRAIGRQLADTGIVAFFDLIAGGTVWPIVSTGLTLTESLVAGRGFARAPTDTGLSSSSSVARGVSRSISDTGVTVGEALTRPGGPKVMPIISRGKPTLSSMESWVLGTAATDGNYQQVWRSWDATGVQGIPSTSAPQWVRVDLSSVADADKTNVWLDLRAPPQETFHYTGTLGSQSGSTALGLPRDYTIEAHAASSAPSATDAGWVVLATITDNRQSPRVHTGLNLAGYNWFRIRCTDSSGPTGTDNDDVEFQLDLRNIADGADDSILVLGDSISHEAWADRLVASIPYVAVGPPQDAIDAATGRAWPPVLHDAAVAGWLATTAYTNRADYIDTSPAKYVILGFGTNDANGAPSAWTDKTDAGAVAYSTAMQNLIDYCEAAGKTVMFGKIPWANLNTWTQNNVQILNQVIDDLWAANPSVIHGPDLYSFFDAHHNLIRDGLHPSFDDANSSQMYAGYTGYEHYLLIWSSHLSSTIYTAQASNLNSRTASDTGLSVSSTLASARTRVAADTGLALGESVARTAARPRAVTDTGVSPGEFLQGGRLFARTVTDTALFLSDNGIVRVPTRVVLPTDTGLSFSEAVTRVTTLGRAVTDTGLSTGDILTGGRAYLRTAADTGLALSDSTATVVQRSYSRTLTDTAVAVTDATAHGVLRNITDTALTSSSSLTARPRSRPVAWRMR